MHLIINQREAQYFIDVCKYSLHASEGLQYGSANGHYPQIQILSPHMNMMQSGPDTPYLFRTHTHACTHAHMQTAVSDNMIMHFRRTIANDALPCSLSNYFSCSFSLAQHRVDFLYLLKSRYTGLQVLFSDTQQTAEFF